MTRETKVGIFVAASFLCLVAVVVAAKLRQVEDPEEEKALANAKIVMPTPLQGSPGTAPTPITNPSVPALIPAGGWTQTGSGENLVAPPPPPSVETPGAQTPAVPDINFPAPTPPAPQPQEVKPVVPSVPSVAESEQAQKMRELANAIKPQAPELPNFPAPPPAPTLVITDPGLPKPSAPDVPSITLQPKKVETKIPAPEPPSLALNTPTQAPSVPSPEAPKPIEPTPVKPEVKITAPAVGSPASFSSGTTQVSDYLVKPYSIEPGDTNFQVISRKLYDSDRYGNALHRFNREYPLAPDSAKADQPRLLPGQQVYFPPVNVLQAKYPSVIPPESDPIRPTIGVGKAVGLVSNPGNPNNQSFVPPSNVPVNPSAIAVTDSGRKYRVRETGEHILEVAQQALGDRRRWSEIYRLNPQIRPDYPIPGGTELKLP